MSEELSDKERSLLEYKEKLLNNIKQCEQQILTAKSSQNRKRLFLDSDSDSDDELVYRPQLYTNTELQQQFSSLCTRYKATQELTGLIVLESSVNVIAEPADLTEKPSVLEDGIWKEVIAECKIDLIAFSIYFYVHQPKCEFSPATFHNMKVNIIKKPHELELEKSVLSDAGTPSDVFLIIKSFAQATRSRRTTLSRISEKYTDGQVFMESLPKGGYVLKCCNVLEIEWHLQNKLSAIAPFYHKMGFDLEYMDREYVKEIKKAYKSIQNPSLTTDERTALLVKVINICREVQKLNESNVSEDTHTSKRMTLDPCDFNHQDIPEGREKDECQVMAPPKTIPKLKKTPQKPTKVIEQRKFKNNLKNVLADAGNTAKKQLTVNLTDIILTDKNKINNEKTLATHKEQLKNKAVHQKDNVKKIDNKENIKHKVVVSTLKTTNKEQVKSINKKTLATQKDVHEGSTKQLNKDDPKTKSSGNTAKVKECENNKKSASNTNKTVTNKEKSKANKSDDTEKVDAKSKLIKNKVAGNSEKTVSTNKDMVKSKSAGNINKISTKNTENTEAKLKNSKELKTKSAGNIEKIGKNKNENTNSEQRITASNTEKITKNNKEKDPTNEQIKSKSAGNTEKEKKKAGNTETLAKNKENLKSNTNVGNTGKETQNKNKNNDNKPTELKSVPNTKKIKAVPLNKASNTEPQKTTTSNTGINKKHDPIKEQKNSVKTKIHKPDKPSKIPHLVSSIRVSPRII